MQLFIFNIKLNTNNNTLKRKMNRKKSKLESHEKKKTLKEKRIKEGMCQFVKLYQIDGKENVRYLI